ncbi:hypothetical protein J5N97_008399 [Dioscorea zingiberensis]|uniref:Nucleolar protein 14 n=1 Tax=Dioscorea zingiberensis TaxID=325984 RepID=A0A9D5CWF4_9LILI|nr:hypothetical protein J5N97_008399 [Dioscorea zingiberensis]
MAKTRDKSNPSVPSKKKGKKRTANGPQAVAMKFSKQSKPNPFEAIWSRSKFSIVGRRCKGEERRTGLARSQATEKRKKTLLKEYEESGKSSKFIDRRIGEKDDTLQEFDKAILRLQRERQLKLKRSNKFNLPDDDDDDDAFNQAHSLSAMDDFEDNISLDDEEEAEEYIGLQNGTDSKHIPLHDMNDLSGTLLQDGSENNQKTKKQVMMEIIAKSKYYKAQKAKDKEEDEHLMEKLDEDFRSLAQSEALRSLTQPSKMNALKALLNKDPTGKTSKEEKTTVEKESFKKEQPDAYDKLVKEMLHDIRARPSDRTKTPEEIAQEERERLELLEEERKKRMLATDDSGEGSDCSDDDEIPDMKKRKSLSGDDLGDSFSVYEETTNKKGWVDDIYEREDAAGDQDNDATVEGSDVDEDDQSVNSDEDSTGDEFDGIPSVKDWEQSDDDDLGTNGEAELEETEMNDNDSKDMKVRKTNSLDNQKANAAGKVLSGKQETLPYVIEVPKNLKELCSLLDNRSNAEVVEAINRIRTCNSIRLTAENRWKMQGFYGVLLQYFATLASQKPLNIERINSLVKPLMEMSGETPFYAAICARERLSHMRTRFCTDIKLQDTRSWPSLKTLLLLRLWSLVFPCSDFRHAVMTPAALLMCEYLIRCPIVSGQDIVVGSFLCSMVLNVCKQSQKFCPEALNFLQILLISAVDLKSGLQHIPQVYHSIELKATKPWLRICNQVSDVHSLDFFVVMNMEADSPYFSSDDFRASVLAFVAEILKGFISIYEGLSSFTEIFSPISSLLLQVLQNGNISQLLRNNLEDIAELIKKKTDEHRRLRRPLQMRKQKPQPIKLLNPKFEEDYVKGRDYDPDRERAEMKKMKRRLKSEKKGAMRELRKDNHFLFQVKQKDRMHEEEERTEKYGKAMAFLQEQEHAFKSGQLGKGKGRKRRK